jgi:hypothetical protein
MGGMLHHHVLSRTSYSSIGVKRVQYVVMFYMLCQWPTSNLLEVAL